MSTQVEIESIEALDFEYTPPCEHSQHTTDTEWHDGAAYALIRATCNGCPHVATYYACEPFCHGWDLSDAICYDCGELTPMTQAFRILSFVGA